MTAARVDWGELLGEGDPSCSTCLIVKRYIGLSTVLGAQFWLLDQVLIRICSEAISCHLIHDLAWLDCRQFRCLPAAEIHGPAVVLIIAVAAWFSASAGAALKCSEGGRNVLAQHLAKGRSIKEGAASACRLHGYIVLERA
jgi:hypothetical protein